MLQYPSQSYFTLEVCEPEGDYLEPLDLAHRLVNQTGVNIFLTGKAGTGKTTFLHRLMEETTKRAVVLAPTGIAAINAGGVTIHSFFQLPFAPYLPDGSMDSREGKKYSFSKTKKRIIRTLDLLIIDEISMVRPDVLDAVDKVLRRYRNPRKPFGGVQLLLIGDLRQLAPVVQPREWEMLSKFYNSPYFFESIALKEAGYVTVELTKVFRQQDDRFLNLLNKVRDNKIDSEALWLLNQRVAGPDIIESQKGIIRLTTHNYLADRINEANMQKLLRDEYVYAADIQGNFPESSYPADPRLTLKVGAQVMFIKNDPGMEKEYYNGLLGIVSSLSADKVYVTTLEEEPRELVVSNVTWENVSYALNEADGKIHEKVEGTFSQIPLRLAWAITIHKSQGLTFDKAVIDASRSFAPGQTYVALSRCRTLEGVYLEAPLQAHAIMTDGKVSTFISSQSQYAPDKSVLEYYSDLYYNTLLHELFDLRSLARNFEGLHRVMGTELQATYPKLVARIDSLADKLNNEIMAVADKFHALIDNLTPYLKTSEEAAAKLDSKIKGATGFFADFIDELLRAVKLIPVDIDNAQVKKRLVTSIEGVSETAQMMLSLIREFSDRPFTVEHFLQQRARVLLDNDKMPLRPARKSKKVVIVTERTDSPEIHDEDPVTSIAPEATPDTIEDIVNPEVYQRLKQWRLAKAEQMGNVPLFVIMHNRTLMNISAAMPRDIDDLKRIKGLGKKKIQQFGEELVNIVWQTENS